MRSAKLPSLAALALAACSGPATPVAKPPPTEPPHVAPPAPALTPARWTTGGGATGIGPALKEGVLVLVGGRRAIVAKDGSVKSETAPAPEAIVEMVEVPTAKGDRRVVGRGAHGIYRFDDPLGAPALLARSEVELSGIGAGPGLVALWDTQSDVPRFLDVEGGKPRPFAGVPELPMRAIAFRSATEGAAVFHAGGLATTIDGGATWKPVTEAVAGDGLRVNGVRLRGSEVRAFIYVEGRDAQVDLAKAKLGALDEPPPELGDAPLLRWIRITGKDPLEAAVAGGVRALAGGAIFASHGMVARVDTRTGMILELVEFARGSGMSSCTMARAGSAAWIACALSEEGGGDLYDPFGVLRLPLDGKALTPEKPTLLRNGEAEMRVSPSGGVMLMGPCSSDEDGSACVRQPDGTWVTFRTDVDLQERGAGPLAGGQVAFLRGHYEGDELSAGESAHAEEEHETAGSGRRLQVVVADAAGKEHGFAPPVRVRGDLRVLDPIEEDEEHNLHFLLGDDEGALPFVQPPGHEVGTPARISGVREGRLHAGFGLAIGEGRVMASVDGGATWSEAPAPKRAREAIAHAGTALEESGVFAVSEVGAKVDTALRVGWGPDERAAEEPAAPAAVVLPPRGEPARGGERSLSCAAESGTATSAPPLVGAHQIKALLGTKAAAPSGTRRESSAAPPGRFGMLDAIALFEEEGPDKPGSSPAKWAIRWYDPIEVGAKARTWSGPAPKKAPWGTTLRSAAAWGSRALFALRSGAKYTLVRTRSGGGAEILDVPFDLLPSSEVVFGTESGEPIAWLHDASLIVWISGEAPRVVASIAAHATRVLGQPSKEGVPVLVGGADWAVMRTVPIPPAGKGAKGASAAPLPLISGWAPGLNLRRDGGRLPACAGGAKGTRVLVQRGALDVTAEGVETAAVASIYDLRVAGGESCASGIAALVAPRARAGAAPPTKAGAPAATIGFVRADLAGHRAEGGERGLGGPSAVRKLSCSLEAKK